jgi:hypothetical protein
MSDLQSQAIARVHAGKTRLANAGGFLFGLAHDCESDSNALGQQAEGIRTLRTTPSLAIHMHSARHDPWFHEALEAFEFRPTSLWGHGYDSLARLGQLLKESTSLFGNQNNPQQTFRAVYLMLTVSA